MEEISKEKSKKSKVYITDVDDGRKAKYRRMAVFIVRHPIVKSVRGRIVTKRNIHGPIYALIAGLSVVTLMSVTSTMSMLANAPVYQPHYDPREVAQQQAAILAGDFTDAKPVERSIPIRRSALPTLPITIVRTGPQSLLVTTEDSAAARAADRGDVDTTTQTTTQQSQVPASDDLQRTIVGTDDGAIDGGATEAQKASEAAAQKKAEEETEVEEAKKKEEKEEEKIDPNRLNPISQKGEWELVYFDKQSYEVDDDTTVEFDTNICQSMRNLGNGHEEVWCSETSKLKDDNAAKVGRDKCPSDCNIGAGCGLWNTEQKKDKFSLYIGNYLCL